MSDPIPKDFHNLRACLLCHLIKHAEQFEKSGCDNCEAALGMRHNRDMVASCTSANFSGMIAMLEPDDSWVSRWQKLTRKTRGMYAIDVSGKLPSGLASELKSMGIEPSRSQR